MNLTEVKSSPEPRIEPGITAFQAVSLVPVLVNISLKLGLLHLLYVPIYYEHVRL